LVLANTEPLEKISEGDLIEELIQNSEKLETLVNELQMNNELLKMRLTIASESYQAMTFYLTKHDELLTETRQLHENYVADIRRTLSMTRTELWFWRIATGLFAGATLYLSVVK
jgi:hypothetical protein